MNVQERWWAGDFGNEYTQRNKIDWQWRRSFWELMVEKAQPRSVLEVGCNAGHNLLALRSVDPTMKLRGVDLNGEALAQAREHSLDARDVSGLEVGKLWPQHFDLVFTAGVLIHVAPADILPMMRSIVRASKKWVLAVEYWAPVEEAVTYRGHEDRLWRRPFGGLYEDLGLTMEATGELGNGDGFDLCTYWLLKKPE